ncbi:MAG: hypothetical protein A2W35_06680 [Chloroflexi bacterium RBG_16_57_11]|nr:MAG: hypothetical protein A2W35_06680 [Chloroflexi bacterium RBG_16_57_11]
MENLWESEVSVETGESKRTMAEDALALGGNGHSIVMILSETSLVSERAARSGRSVPTPRAMVPGNMAIP